MTILRYPQLSTGAVTQFPFKRTAKFRTIVNELLSGEWISYVCDGAQTTSWQLSYKGLSDEERQAIEDLFSVSEGRLKPFAFADPSGNLLLWSEKLDETVWTASPYLQSRSGVADRYDTLRASRLTNTGQAEQSISQELPDLGSGTVQFSVWVRSSSAVEVVASMMSAGNMASSVVVAGSAWTELGCSISSLDSEPATCTLVIPAGAIVDVFGFQANFGLNPAAYRATRERAALYPKTYFAEDELVISSDGPNSSSADISLISYYERNS